MKKSGAFHKTSVGVTKPTTVQAQDVKLSKPPGAETKASPPPPPPAKIEPPSKQA